ncbi:FkbM family methyltransferase [Paenarthrobacter ilicis]|uniref:FkbM family methyltransferase n=1 Tax=Paenarthrobacter ilicis TaxID=43665 RepID=A0ABX0TCW2_9MICC|nr:FkbM family methyltransferase [Paenarthrobacter ilicis]NIJ00358.1 FkbM family methyltransferase [Paenarthrobacter ilicis]
MKQVEIVANGSAYQIVLPDAENDYIQKTIASTKKPYEEAMLVDMAAIVKPGDLVLDIGANCGNHTLFLSCVSGAFVHAFEPDAELCAAISTSVAANGAAERITVHQVGVGDANGFGRIVQTAENNRGAQRLERTSMDEQSVAIIRLDDQEFEAPVKAIKIDVEGMELDVLRGSSELIQRDHPEMYVECQTVQDFEKIHQFLEPFGYRYKATFNATPTHRFGFDGAGSNTDRLEQVVKQQVSATYYDRKLIGDLRLSLSQANLKYRESTALLAQLKERLEANTATLKRDQDHILDLQNKLNASEEALVEAHLALERKADEVRALDGISTSHADALRQVAALREELAGRAAQIVELRLQHEQRLILSPEYENRLAAGARAQEQLASLGQKLDAQASHIHDLERNAKQNHDELRAVGDALAVSSRAKDKLVAAANTRSAVLSDVRSRLSFERGRVKSVEKLMAQINSLNLALRSELSDQQAILDSERSRFQSELNNSELRLRQVLKHVKQLRAKLATTNSRAEELETRLADSVDRLKVSQGKLTDAQTRLFSAQQSVDEGGRRLTVEKGLVARLERDLKDARAHSESLKIAEQALIAARDKSEASLSSVSAELKSANEQADRRNLERQNALKEVESLRDELTNTRLQLAQAEEKTRLLRTSITYRLGQTLRNSLQSPEGLLKLPVALGVLMKENNRKKLSADATPKVASTLVDPIAVATSSANVPGLVNRAAEIRQDRRLPNSAATESLRLKESDKVRRTRVAAIMDAFTVHSFAPECDLLELSLGRYIQELEDFKPHLIFLESAWRGRDDEWGNKVAQTATQVREIISWANHHNIKVILWNKEDPVHYSTFLNTAKLVDHVFTTDIDCVQRYKGDLGHDRVHFLPFACQPFSHNPLELYSRDSGLCFAGAYYRRYPDRTRDLESFIEKIPEYRSIEIFDRNFGKTDEQYQFPAEYQKYIVGTLDSAEIDLAYKGYDYAINLNSVKESQSMFARRVYELLASNTTVVSNYSRGLELMFGGIPVISDSGQAVVEELRSVSGELEGRKRRLAGLRKVMSEHTYAHRLDYILSKVESRSKVSTTPIVHVFSLVSRDAEIEAVRKSADRQAGVTASLRLFTNNPSLASRFEDVALTSDLHDVELAQFAEAGEFVGFMHPDDYYGPCYLLDLALAVRYTSAQVVGKATYMRATRRGPASVGTELAYTAVERLPIRSSLILDPTAVQLRASEWIKSAANGDYSVPAMMQTEIFDYCRAGAKLKPGYAATVDGNWSDIGLSLENLTSASDRIKASELSTTDLNTLTGKDLSKMFLVTKRPGVDSWVSGDSWNFESTLDDGRHDYIYSSEMINLHDIADDDGLKFHAESDPGLNLQIAIIYYNNDTKIAGLVRTTNQNHTLDVPPEATHLKVGIRIFSSGSGAIRRVLWEHKDMTPEFIAQTADNLVITNRYPSSVDLYKNGFVHTRVRRYIQAGVPTEVFVLDETESLRFREFEGVSVITGNSETLDSFLKQGFHRSISVHFITESMWNSVSRLPHQPRIAIWAHGADIQSWSRREFLYDEDSKDAARTLSDARLSLWSRIFADSTENVKVVFVSDWLRRTALEDLGLEVSDKSVVIHNPINASMFSYNPKDDQKRLKVLSVRPYASAVYANDLSVEAIRLLSDTPHFNEMEFRLVGDGPLFDEITKPLEAFDNVILDKRFLTQDEIAKMHQEYGVFLCPSRMDTQGVSRDEAMSSGLVPVTTAVAAIPEFADETCAEIVDPEDASALADAMLSLISSPRLYRRKSQAAAKRVRSQSDADVIVPKELAVLGRG